MVEFTKQNSFRQLSNMLNAVLKVFKGIFQLAFGFGSLNSYKSYFTNVMLRKSTFACYFSENILR